MSQFLRPDGNVTQTSFTNGFAEIDEAVASDADFAYGANGVAATLEVSLSNPAATPGNGTTTVRYRVGRTNNGVLNGSGNACTVTCSVYQGATLIASDAARTASGTWTAYSFTPDMSGVTDWADLRLRFVTSASGGSSANKRGGAISWAELEAPDAAAAIAGTLARTLGGATVSSAGGLAIAGGLAKTLGSATVAATATVHDNTSVSGSLSKALGGLSLTATGSLPIRGQTSLTLGGLGRTATAKLSLGARVVKSLNGMTASAVFALRIAGQAVKSLGGMTITARGHGPAQQSWPCPRSRCRMRKGMRR